MGIHIGTSGWSYAHWANVLFPDGLRAQDRLEHYVRHFRTVELNASFYRWPTDAAFASWRRRLPTDFVLSVKAPRAMTHAKRLYAPDDWLVRIARGLTRLGAIAGPLLVQLSPSLAYDHGRLEYFLRGIARGLRVTVEFRHPSWHQESVFDLLRRYDAAYCVMSGAGLPCVLQATASFVYVRLHGPDHHHLYGGSYSDRDLHWWADRIREWARTERDVFVYFNNDGGGNAVTNALSLARMLNG
jgi:uncharacterized protein YecE (DUF72 family)